MKHLKTFENYAIDADNISSYELLVAQRVVALMEERLGPLSKMVVGDDKIGYVKDLIGGRVRNGEYDVNYPDTFEMSCDDFWENDEDFETAAEYFVDGCCELYNGHGSAM